MRLKIVFFLLFFAFLNSFATGQAPDIIYYKGIKYSLHANPLESYFEKFPEKRPESNSHSTGLWRGYIATFEIADNKLFVTDVVTEAYQDTAYTQKSVFKEIFGDVKRVGCDFYTGLLILPYGEIVHYVHMGYASIYENYILLEIHDGAFTKSRKMDGQAYYSFKEKQFKAYKKTEDYKKQYDFYIKISEENDGYAMMPDLGGPKKKIKNKYLEEKERLWKRDKQIEGFIRIFSQDYATKIPLED